MKLSNSLSFSIASPSFLNYIFAMSREEIKKYLEQLLGQKLKDRPIRAIGVNPRYHGLPKRLIEEGGIYDNLEPGAPSERVLAIFEGTLFCVCTSGRGAGTGMPYLFHREDIYTVEYF